MTCEHISKALDKINNLIKKSNDTDSALYRKLGPIADKEDIETYLDGGFWSGYKARTSYKTYTFPYIYPSALYDDLSDIFDELKSCNCRGNLASQFSKEFDNLSSNAKDKYNNLVGEWNELKDKYNSLVEKYNNLSSSSVSEYNSLRDKFNELVDKFNGRGKDYEFLREKYNKLVDEYNDKKSDYEEYKEKYEDTNEKLHSEKLKHANESGNEKLRHLGEKSQLQIQNTKLQEKLEAANSEKIDLRKRLKDKEEENNRLLIKLDDKNNQLTVLRLESGKKDEEIRGLKNQAKSSDKRAEKSQEELLTEKIRSEKSNLELFATELRVGLEQTNGLVRYHERLFRARKNRNQANIETHENNITGIKEELQNNGISIVNIQEICRKCERIAELRWELEQQQQQFQAQQEVPTNNF